MRCDASGRVNPGHCGRRHPSGELGTVVDVKRHGSDVVDLVCRVDGGRATPRYVRRPFRREPNFGVTSVSYDLDELLARSETMG